MSGNETSFRRSLFIFRRDLRLEDNTALIEALKSSVEVVPCFIFTPEQIDENPYRSDHCVKFMNECLADLQRQLEEAGGRLYLFKGKPEEIVRDCILQIGIDAVFVNRDYTPYSKRRDKLIEESCKLHGASFHSFEDALLQPPELLLKQDGKPYQVFTPFYRNALQKRVRSPFHNRWKNYYRQAIPFDGGGELLAAVQPAAGVTNSLRGGRGAALKILKDLSVFDSYADKRDFPAEDRSTHLSAYLKFNVCSIREIYAEVVKQLGPQHDLVRSLYWRDFFTGLAFFFPHVFGGAFYPKFNKLRWRQDEAAFQRWCQGMTGFPIVDAGMREMNETGFMHNRVRMIVASFLIKDLHIDWRWGEKYFAQTLVDYDPAVNNGNWQWSASTGCDAQPYFRIFNPWSQQKKFDEDCVYIKKWVPELRLLSPKEIHAWHQKKVSSAHATYPPPMVDHAVEAQAALEAYRCL